MKFIWNYLRDYKKYMFLNFLCVFGFVLVQIGIPTLLAVGINNRFMGGKQEYIFKLASFMAAIAIFGLGSLIVLAYSTNRLVSNLVMDMRNDFFRKTQYLSKDDYDEFGISRLVTNIGTDAYTIMQFLIMLLRTGFMAPIMFTLSLVMIFMKSSSLAIITLVAIPLMLVAIVLINAKTKPLSQKQQEGLDNINLQIRESLSGIRIIRGFNNEEFMSKRFDTASIHYANISKKMFQTVAFISPVFTITFTIVIALVMQLGSQQVHLQILEYGSLVAFIEYVFHALFSFLMLATVLMVYPRAAVAVSRLEEVMEAEASIQNSEKTVENSKIKGIIEFKDVSFSYSDSAEKSVLKHVSFKANPGETVAFIGSTGSGKSTIMKLIPRIVDVTEGSILIDGVDVRDYKLSDLRNNIGYVPQKASLFSGSIKDNLLFGNRQASMERLEKAASIAQAEEFISSNEAGFNRTLSEGATNLSGGQRQRLCIARALTRDVPIYIFDDSFSALDYKTDSILRRRLKEEIQDATFLVVAQRVGTVMDADKILVVDNGEIVGVGKHRELLKNCEVYYEIASSQLSEEELKL